MVAYTWQPGSNTLPPRRTPPPRLQFCSSTPIGSHCTNARMRSPAVLLEKFTTRGGPVRSGYLRAPRCVNQRTVAKMARPAFGDVLYERPPQMVRARRCAASRNRVCGLAYAHAPRVLAAAKGTHEGGVRRASRQLRISLSTHGGYIVLMRRRHHPSKASLCTEGCLQECTCATLVCVLACCRGDSRRVPRLREEATRRDKKEK